MSIALPSNIYRYVWETSGWHQLPLVGLTGCVSLLEVAPLELQRRIVNDVVKHRDYRFVLILCAVYATSSPRTPARAAPSMSPRMARAGPLQTWEMA